MEKKPEERAYIGENKDVLKKELPLEKDVLPTKLLQVVAPLIVFLRKQLFRFTILGTALQVACESKLNLNLKNIVTLNKI